MIEGNEIKLAMAIVLMMFGEWRNWYITAHSRATHLDVLEY